MHMNRYSISHNKKHYIGTLTHLDNVIMHHCMRIWMVAWPKTTSDLLSIHMQRSIEENDPDGVKAKERDPYKKKTTQIGLT